MDESMYSLSMAREIENRKDPVSNTWATCFHRGSQTPTLQPSKLPDQTADVRRDLYASSMDDHYTSSSITATNLKAVLVFMLKAAHWPTSSVS